MFHGDSRGWEENGPVAVLPAGGEWCSAGCRAGGHRARAASSGRGDKNQLGGVAVHRAGRAGARLAGAGARPGERARDGWIMRAVVGWCLVELGDPAAGSGPMRGAEIDFRFGARTKARAESWCKNVSKTEWKLISGFGAKS